MKRYKHNLSYNFPFSMNMGNLIPCGWTETIPGDTIQHNISLFARMSPMHNPVMHTVHTRVNHWFVPYRLIWDEFEDFITGGEDGLNSSVFPTINITTPVVAGSLAEMLGVPVGYTGLVSALNFRAYVLIYNEHIRDQDLQTALALSTSSGADTTTVTDLQKVLWEKDYFTSARPDSQKGPDITIPIAGEAPVLGIGKANQSFLDIPGGATVYESDGTSTTYSSAHLLDGGISGAMYVDNGSGSPDNLYPNIRADLSQATPVTINQLKLAFAQQTMAEARMRYGSRYSEYLRYLGVKTSDGRLQRPEYLGGGKQTMQFSEVIQTAEGTNPVGELYGHGSQVLRSNRYRRYFEEHGVIMSLINTKPKTVYHQGLHKFLSSRTREDFFQKEFQYIGMEEIKNKELYAAHADPEGTFGWQDRYNAYREHFSRVGGEFHTLLKDWTLVRDFASDPALNAAFIEANPSDRIFASTATDQMYVTARHSMQARRMIGYVK